MPYRSDNLSNAHAIIDAFQRPTALPNFPTVNVIPDGEPGRCLPVLVVAIGASDSVEKYILLAVEHISTRCPGGTRHIVFYAAKWNHKDYLKHRDSFHKLNVTVNLKVPGANAVTIA